MTEVLDLEEIIQLSSFYTFEMENVKFRAGENIILKILYVRLG
jgi:hypothetical protein